MAELWERRCDLRHLTLAQITELLCPALPGHRVRAAELLPTGLVNTNYRVELEGLTQPVVLRISVRDPATTLREARLLARLPATVPVPEVVYAIEHPTADGWHYAVHGWVEGQRLADLLPFANEREALPLARQLGEILAAVGTVTFEQPGFLDTELEVAQPFDSAVEAYLAELLRLLGSARVTERLGGALGSGLQHLVADRRALLEGYREARQLVHADFGPRNLLVRRGAAGWEVAAVLDWEFAHAGCALLDLGILFRYHELLPPGFAAAFAEGCAAAGQPLPDNWLELARLLDLVCLVQLLDAARDDAQMVHLRERLAASLACCA
ncbi:MAG: phosphotransferase [Armatimonadetes bacterium]|nr:phosphotransferase [Armatimonadota bacterium]